MRCVSALRVVSVGVLVALASGRAAEGLAQDAQTLQEDTAALAAAGHVGERAHEGAHAMARAQASGDGEMRELTRWQKSLPAELAPISRHPGLARSSERMFEYTVDLRMRHSSRVLGQCHTGAIPFRTPSIVAHSTIHKHRRGPSRMTPP